ncbi:hypothetical protein ACIROP_06835 [Bacillus velezensis]
MKPPHDASAAGQIAASGHGADRLLSQGRRPKTKVPRKLQNADVLHQSGAF